MVRSLLRFPSEIHSSFKRPIQVVRVFEQCLLFLRERKERVTFKEAGT